MAEGVLFCRLPGLLARAARQERSGDEAAAPLAVAEGRRVRDACPLARARGVAEGASVLHARRLCPAVLVVPVEGAQAGALTRSFLDTLADLSPVVEPEGEDAAYAGLSGICPAAASRAIAGRLQASLSLAPVIGLGPSGLAARACAECRLPSERLAEADARWLWPEDAQVVARLRRLGLVTFGDVAAVGESALVYQFGRIGRLLYRRARGQDLAPVRALYPPPRADARCDLSEHPVDDRERLHWVLAQAAEEAARQLRHLSRFGRRLVLRVLTENEEQRREWVLPAPVQETADVLWAARRLLSRMPLSSPVIGLRLLVEDLEMPTVRTLELLSEKGQAGKVALDAAERALCARYGSQALTRLGHLPISPREERRQLVKDALLSPRP